MKIIFTLGDINGIGLEVLFKAIQSNIQWLKNHTLLLNNAELSIDNYEYSIKSIGNIVRNSAEAGKIAYQSIETATKLCLSSPKDSVLVTLPVSKENIAITYPSFIGHTEMLSKLCGVKKVLMILFCGNFRMALTTTHIPLYKVNSRITSKRLRELIKAFNMSLIADFEIINPKIAVLSLNPHCGDNGLFGNEEQKIIQPAIEVMQRKGISVKGAFAADGFFASKAYCNYDGVLAMYHDQGLIPLKMLAANGGVNFTAGLPIVRTSPSHGTAFDIARKNIANPQSMIEAINAAINIKNNRNKN